MELWKTSVVVLKGNEGDKVLVLIPVGIMMVTCGLQLSLLLQIKEVRIRNVYRCNIHHCFIKGNNLNKFSVETKLNVSDNFQTDDLHFTLKILY